MFFLQFFDEKFFACGRSEQGLMFVTEEISVFAKSCIGLLHEEPPKKSSVYRNVLELLTEKQK